MPVKDTGDDSRPTKQKRKLPGDLGANLNQAGRSSGRDSAEVYISIRRASPRKINRTELASGSTNDFWTPMSQLLSHSQTETLLGADYVSFRIECRCCSIDHNLRMCFTDVKGKSVALYY